MIMIAILPIMVILTLRLTRALPAGGIPDPSVITSPQAWVVLGIYPFELSLEALSRSLPSLSLLIWYVPPPV